jgi:predicted O-methyltransferase YrrM|tara:strand:+ start:81 stop:887 length:807 start_codon:yes stop_codon:yes gene_type:complete
MNFQSFIKNLIKPHQIPFKIIKKILILYQRKIYDFNKFQKEQNSIFKYFNLDRDNALRLIEKIKTQFPFLNRNMSSEHEVFFSGLSLLNAKIEKVLEIGTHDGKNSLLLSLLFNNAEIDTIDLPQTSKNFTKYYNRENKLDDFIKSRNEIIKKNNKIKFIETNSINLLNSNKKYDLIWIDGAHGYPVVCIDIINSLRLINDGGIIMCDDIYVNEIVLDKMYNSTATFETLNELANENIIEYKLIYKRLDSENNCEKKKRKFIGVFRKT